MIEDAINILTEVLRREVKCIPVITYDSKADTLVIVLQGISRNFNYCVFQFSRAIYRGTPMSVIAKRVLGEYKKFIINYFFFTIDKK